MDSRTSLPSWLYLCAAVIAVGSAFVAVVLGPAGLLNPLGFALAFGGLLSALLIGSVGKVVALLDEIAQRLKRLQPQEPPSEPMLLSASAAVPPPPAGAPGPWRSTLPPR